MSVMLICTLGNRDLQLSNEIIRPAREKGREIYENFDAYYPDLSYPIIRPMFDYVFQEERQDKINRIILVATDQNEDTDPKYRNNDTIEFARIIHRMIQKEHGAKVEQIRFLKIPHSPSYLDIMYEFFGQRLKKDKAFKSDNAFDMEALETCYVEQTGGIPSANMGLLYQCINHFKEKCHPVYVSETHNIVPLDLVNKVMTEKKKTILQELAETFGYAAMAAHLDEKSPSETFVLRLSQYAQHRLYFDTLTARTIARRAMRDFPHDREFFGNLLSELEQIESGDYVRLILELFHNLRIKYGRKEFVDFLGRLYRFQEAVPRYLIEQEFGISTDVNPKTGKQAGLDKLLGDDKELRAFVVSQKMSRGGSLDPNRIGTPRLIAMLDFLIEKKAMKKLRPISTFFKKTSNLMNIRNQSIIAHGFKGISQEIIKEHYEGDVLGDLKTVVSLVLEKSDLTIEDEPFERINTVLSERIQQL